MEKITVAHRIREIMKAGGLTQQDLSQLLGISQPAISLYLKGRMPPADILLRIARLGNRTVEWLLTGQESPFSAAVKEASPDYGNHSGLLSLWNQLPPRIQRDLLTLMRHIALYQENKMTR